MATEKEKQPSFEQALAELEKIVGEVEQGQVGLEQSIEKYEKGMKMVKHCREILEVAEKRIEVLGKDLKAPNPDDEQA